MIVRRLTRMRVEVRRYQFPNIIPLTILSLSLTVWLARSFVLNISDSSAPRGIYRIKPIAQAQLGDLVVMRMPVKVVAAVEGQHVRFTASGVYVDGKLLPNSAPEPELARRCPFGDYVVPANMFLPMGLEDPDSYDGRYQCFETRNLIRGKAVPVLTW